MKEIILNNLDTFFGAILTGIAGFLFGKKVKCRGSGVRCR